jgi:hypothetical protein
MIIVLLAINVFLLIMMIFGYNVLSDRMKKLDELHGIALKQFETLSQFMETNIKSLESQEQLNSAFAEFSTNQAIVNIGVGSSLKELFSKVNQ